MQEVPYVENPPSVVEGLRSVEDVLCVADAPLVVLVVETYPLH